MSSIQATFLIEEQELLGEVTRSNIRKVLEKHTGENPDLHNSSKGKDIVVFLGKTGSGKSTLINFLSGKELKVDENGNIVLKDPMDSSAMRIGIGQNSETFLPKYIKSNGLLFYDLAGFCDTRGTAISLVNACFIKNIIENAATARLVFVIGQDEITAGRGEHFKQLTIITRDLIPNEIIERFSSLVITKSTPGRNKKQLINFLQTKTDPEILAPWIEQGRLVKMSSPLGEDIDLNDQANILDSILNTPRQKIKNINISVIYSDKELNNLRKVYSGEIEDATNELIKNNFDANTLSSLDKRTLENKKQYFQSNFLKDVFLSVDTSPLIDLLRPISEKIYKLSRDEMKNNISLKSDKIVGLIEVEIKDQERKKEEQSRIHEENLRKAEEIKRKQVEFQLHQAEIRRLEEEKRYVQEMKEQKAKEEERIKIEESKRLQAEQKAAEERVVRTKDGANTGMVTGNKYKIKNYYSGNILNGWGCETGIGTATMAWDENHSHRFWYFEKQDYNTYKIKNCYSGNILSTNGGTGKGTATMENDANVTLRRWCFIKWGDNYKIWNVGNGSILNSWGCATGKGTATMGDDIAHSHRLWSFIDCGKR